MQFDLKKIKKHEKILREEIFFNNTKWPHFDLLFNDIKNFSQKLRKNKKVISLERNRLYDGISLFAPFFKQEFISVDCYTDKLFKRGSYNQHLTKNKNILKKYKNYSFHYKNIKIKSNSADLILIPNLMHHIEDVDFLLKKAKKILKKNGQIYIFEPLVRELHQMPEDFGRYTPYGFKNKLEKIGFKNFKIKFNGGPFTAAAYCWDQAIQYLPNSKRQKEIKWMNKKIDHFKKLDKKFSKNLVRKNTMFPMSFSISAKK